MIFLEAPFFQLPLVPRYTVAHDEKETLGGRHCLPSFKGIRLFELPAHIVQWTVFLDVKLFDDVLVRPQSSTGADKTGAFGH